MNRILDEAFALCRPEKRQLNGVSLYILDASLLEEAGEHPEWRAVCSARRWEGICRCRPGQEQKNRVGAGLLTGYVFREEKVPFSPENIVIGSHGKPYHPQLHFNLSHSGCFVVCAVADGEVGCDIQKRKTCRENMVRRFFAPEEQQYILSAFGQERDWRFTKLWSRKESYFKMTGEGLIRELRDYSFLSGEGFAELLLEDYHISVYTGPERQPLR